MVWKKSSLIWNFFPWFWLMSLRPHLKRINMGFLTKISWWKLRKNQGKLLGNQGKVREFDWIKIVGTLFKIKLKSATFDALADPKGRQGRTPPSLSNFFYFHAVFFWQKCCQIIGFCPIYEILDPPLWSTPSLTPPGRSQFYSLIVLDDSGRPES